MSNNDTEVLTHEECKTLRYIYEHEMYQWVPTQPQECGLIMSIARDYEFAPGAIQSLQDKGLMIVEDRRIRLTRSFNEIRKKHPEIMKIKLSSIAWSLHRLDPGDPRYKDYDQYNDEEIDWE